MLFRVFSRDGKQRIGDTYPDAVPKVGSVINCNSAEWRVVNTEWPVVVANNNISSGVLYVEPIEDDKAKR
jgi:hypothetical protein